MAKKILVASAIVDFGEKLARAVEAVRAVAGPRGVEVVSVESIDWQRLRHLHMGYDGAYRWTAATYDGIALVETAAGGLGRGTFEMGRHFADAGKPVYVVRGATVQKCTVAPWDADDWKQRFGRAITELTQEDVDPDPTNGEDALAEYNPYD